MFPVDLHTHSKASDGALTPTDLVLKAINEGITHLALTDHDTILGLHEAFIAATGTNLTLIPGIEASCTWNHEQIHIVGLGIDLNSTKLQEFCSIHKVKREERASKIGYILSRIGFDNAYEEAKKRAGVGASITRGNYARLIFEMGGAVSVDDAFNKYLKRGKRAYVVTNWLSLQEVIDYINKAGGIAILAHPRRYTFTNRKLRKLLDEFKQSGGVGMEINGCQQRDCDRQYLNDLAKKYELYASLGSDFHADGAYRSLGGYPSLDDSLVKIWEHEKINPYFKNFS